MAQRVGGGVMPAHTVLMNGFVRSMVKGLGLVAVDVFPTLQGQGIDAKFILGCVPVNFV